jgi:hypothetical protein
MQGHFFFHTGTKQFVMSLGFRKWAAVGVKASEHIIDEKAAKLCISTACQ